jgi:hypothetical protein
MGVPPRIEGELRGGGGGIGSVKHMCNWVSFLSFS